MQVLSRHPSHNTLRGLLRGIGKGMVLRLGSTTESTKPCLNTAEAIRNSANKLLMKECFTEAGVSTAHWTCPQGKADVIEFCGEVPSKKYIVKSLFGSRGRGLHLFETVDDIVNFFNQGKYGKYILEKYYDYNREYRLHVSRNGCFYTCRKMLRSDATERWYRNDSNCVWIVEENPDFQKPDSWDAIEEDCVKALNSVGLDLGACDVRVNEKGNWIICEINSAASHGEITVQKYYEEIKRLVNQK